MMTLSNDYYSRIVIFEGFRNTAYKCPSGIWTIGYGTTKGVKAGDKVSVSQAYAMMREDSEEIAKLINGMGVKLQQCQFDAVALFCYNLGFYKFKASTLCKMIRRDASDKRIFREWQRWVYASGKKLNGLIQRRRNEVELYFRHSGYSTDELQNV